MSRILKFALPSKVTELQLTVDHRILAVASIEEMEFIWVEQDGSAAAHAFPVRFHVLMTGEYVPDGCEHVGTDVSRDLAGRLYVVHFYREVPF